MKKILVIEDEEEISKMLTKGFRKMGFEVEVANCGEIGLHHLKHQIPDLIVLDLMIPCLSGEEVCKAIREDMDAHINQIPIIMLTAKNTDADQIVGRVLGANSYVRKPFEWDYLLKEINRVLPIEKV